MNTYTAKTPIPENEIGGGESLSMAPYTGPWTKAQAAHLLRRTVFGPSKQQIEDAVANGMNATVDTLLTLPAETLPVTYSPDEAVSSIGNTWINDYMPATNQQPTITARILSLFGWINQELFNPTLSIKEKMTLFWQNHFAATNDNEPRMAYDYVMLLRNSCLGNFRQLVKDMTINPQMLVFLNGTTNNKFSPNENYARELLELYTIGKGPQIADGDYTNYTEHDIAEIAKIMTGWIVENYLAESGSLVTSNFYDILHDPTTKQLSEKFNDAVIQDAGDAEYAQLIDIIFQQDEVARHICRKLYRWFVNYDLTPIVNSTIIEEMADVLIANDYEIEPVMDMLLRSEHFYDIALRGTIIKNPIEYATSMYKSTKSEMSYGVVSTYEIYNIFGFLTGDIGMSYFAPPQVAGWTAYYQQPGFSQMWINAAMIKKRVEYSWFALYNGVEATNGDKYPIDVLGLLNSFDFPADDIEVIRELEVLFCCKPLSAAQRTFLANTLNANFGSAVWAGAYNNYIADPSDQQNADIVANQMRVTLLNLFKMPEFHII